MRPLRDFLQLNLGDVRVTDPALLVPLNPSAPFWVRQTGDGTTEAQRLQRARLVVERLVAGWRPGAAELDGAPVLAEWAMSAFSTLELTGIVFGHPKIDDGRYIHTSVVVVLDRQHRWARTVSRWYRLGVAATEDDDDE